MSTLRSLQDLKIFQRELALARRLEEERLEREAAAARLADQERRIFELSVGPIIALPKIQQRVQHHRVPPAPEPLQREADERQVLLQALSDDFDVESLLETDDSLSYRRPEISTEVLKKLRRGHWSLQAQIDLQVCAASRHGRRWATSSMTPTSAACVACAWCTARAMDRQVASPCSRAACGAGWCKRLRCWPSCRRAAAMAAPGR